MAATFENSYYLEPWSGWTLNQRDWYVPTLIMEAQQTSFFGQLVPVRTDPSTKGTGKMIWTGLYPPEPNWNAVSDHSYWVTKMHPAGWRQEITMETHSGGMGLHKHDPLVTFWEQAGAAQRQGVLRQITKQFVAGAIVKHLEWLIMGAYVRKQPGYIVGHSWNDGLSALTNTDTYDIRLSQEIGLDFEYANPQPGYLPSTTVYLTPGQALAIRTDDTNWISVQKYSDWGIRRAMNWEIGAYPGAGRFLRHPMPTLYNMGPLTAQIPVTAAIVPGEGAPDPSSSTVRQIRKVGQESGVSKRYVQCAAPASWNVNAGSSGWSNIKVGDVLTIFTDPTPAGVTTSDAAWPFNIQHAPHPWDGTLTFRQVVSVDADNHRIVLDQPIQKSYETDLGGGVYAYIAKGLHVHAAIHVDAPGAVVGAFAQPPQIMFPPAVDDRLAQYRVTYDFYGKYNMFMPERYHVVYSAGKVSRFGYAGLGD